jgi:hypothetical protein
LNWWKKVAEKLTAPFAVPLVAASVDHLCVEVEDGSGFDRAYWVPASSQVVLGLVESGVVEVTPSEVAVSVGAVGVPPPVIWYANVAEYWWKYVIGVEIWFELVIVHVAVGVNQRSVELPTIGLVGDAAEPLRDHIVWAGNCESCRFAAVC